MTDPTQICGHPVTFMQRNGACSKCEAYGEAFSTPESQSWADCGCTIADWGDESSLSPCQAHDTNALREQLHQVKLVTLKWDGEADSCAPADYLRAAILRDCIADIERIINP